MSDWISLARLDGVAQAELCAKGEVSERELRDAALRRLDFLNPLLRAVVTIARETTGAARPAGDARPRSALAGVPFLMKDASPWPGLRWGMGSRLLASNVAPKHTPYSAALEGAGLVCIGKSATSEFGLLGSTETLAEGVTHNPWDLAYSAGGSSGGSAAAVAAGIVPFAHANDGGGSIRIPASMTGLFGFKPSKGRTLYGAYASSEFLEITSDHCISRSVRDSAHFLALTEDTSTREAIGLVQPSHRRPQKVVAYTRTALGEYPDSDVQRAFDAAIALVGSLGHEVTVIDGPALEGNALGDAFYLVAGSTIAGVVDMMDKMRGVPVQETELERFTWALVNAAVAGGVPALEGAREAFRSAVRSYKEATANYDVVMTPTLATRAWQIGHLSPTLDRDVLFSRTARAVGYTPLQNIAGCPAMSVPLSFSDGALPIGIHFAAAAGEDARLMSLAYELEEAAPWKDRWAPYSIPRLV